MIQTFLATLTPMLTLFLMIVLGFTLRRGRLLPDNAGKTMAKLENWAFLPALSFMTQARYFRIETLSTHATNVLLAGAMLLVAIGIALLLARYFAKPSSSEYGIYLYAITFANFGYMGDPIVQALYGDVGLSYYKLFCLPLSIGVYTFGISCMVKGKSGLRSILNPPTLAMVAGMVIGLVGAIDYFPAFVINTLDSLQKCMAPVAMLLAGFTVASYDLKEMLTDKKVYLCSALRLTVLPAILIAVLFGFKELLNLIFGFSIGNMPLFLLFFAAAGPLGLNTVVFPEAYGGSPKTGAGMALISHTLAVITIPLMLALMLLIFKENPLAALAASV